MSDTQTIEFIKRVNISAKEISKINAYITKQNGRKIAAKEIGITPQALGDIIRNGYCNSETLTKIRAKIN